MEILIENILLPPSVVSRQPSAIFASPYDTCILDPALQTIYMFAISL